MKFVFSFTMQAAFRYKDSTSVGEDTEAESERL